MKEGDDVQNKDENIKASDEDSEIQPQLDHPKEQKEEQGQ